MQEKINLSIKREVLAHQNENYYYFFKEQISATIKFDIWWALSDSFLLLSSY